MISVALIRHSVTEGNKLKRYIGVTDEPLCMEGIRLIEGKTYPEAQAVYVSPMKRCRETAMIIYPDRPHIVMEDFREIDFGDFENKNYKELSGNPDYQKWIDSNGTLPFPNGESQESFSARCMDAFFKMLEDARGEDYRQIAAVVHGGTIMVIMDHFLKPDDYYKYMAKNGEGYILNLDLNSGDGCLVLSSFLPIGGEECRDVS
ncbi:MAG: histidine phosphatase family protein [Lachnospiraceae bacterium]|nr:histidine phosphatase family protein [Lachnospiraceae bacterium]